LAGRMCFGDSNFSLFYSCPWMTAKALWAV
jgi:hypothetical protein